jgi:NAD(P)H-flavin reductase
MVTVATDELIAGIPTVTLTIDEIVDEGADTYTYWGAIDDPLMREEFRFLPGQISMLGVFGVGEIPISVSSDPERPERLAHTVRICGRVTKVIEALKVGDQVTVRGPFGRPWPVESARGGDLVIFAGGLGLAPLRSAIYSAIHHRFAYRRVILLIGAKDPSQILFRDQLEAWKADPDSGLEVHLTVDEPDDEWPHRVGIASSLFPYADLDTKAATVFTCGPEVMMRFGLRDLSALGFPDERLWLTMERNMHCGVKLCGHCQLGPYFVCADGPIFRYDQMKDLLEVSEL